MAAARRSSVAWMSAALTQAGFAELFAATKTPQPLEKLRRTCREDLFQAAEKAARWTLAQGVFS